jgi:hypothetical protein
MAATLRRIATVTALVVAASAAAAAQPGAAPGSRAWVESLKAEWSRPVGGKTRFVGVEEYGRCSVFVDRGVVQVVTPAGEVSWTWSFSMISKYINPREVAVSHECDAIAFVGDASYKHVWIVDRAGTSASIKLAATPADVEFDRQGMLVAVGTYAGSMHLYSRNGTFQWDRPTKASIVQGIEFSDDNQHIRFKDWSGSGVVSVAGHVEWSAPAPAVFEDEPATAPRDYRWQIAVSGDGSRRWLRGEDVIDCIDEQGTVLARINAAPSIRGVKVSRDFSQVMVVTDKALHPVSVERYAVPAPCGK